MKDIIIKNILKSVLNLINKENNMMDMIIITIKQIFKMFPTEEKDKLIDKIVDYFFEIIDNLPKKKQEELLKTITKELIVISLNY